MVCRNANPLIQYEVKETNGRVVMGLISIRQIPHLNETYVFPAIPPNWGFFSILRLSQAKEISFQGIHSKKPFYIAPYVIVVYSRKACLMMKRLPMM